MLPVLIANTEQKVQNESSSPFSNFYFFPVAAVKLFAKVFLVFFYSQHWVELIALARGVQMNLQPLREVIKLQSDFIRGVFSSSDPPGRTRWPHHLLLCARKGRFQKLERVGAPPPRNAVTCWLLTQGLKVSKVSWCKGSHFCWDLNSSLNYMLQQVSSFAHQNRSTYLKFLLCPKFCVT